MTKQQETPDDCVCIFEDSKDEQIPLEDQQEQCFEMAESGYFCTRPPGHEGNHVACGNMGDHYHDEWEQDD